MWYRDEKETDIERTTTGKFFFLIFNFYFLRSGYGFKIWIGFEKFGWIDFYLGIWVTLGFDLIFLKFRVIYDLGLERAKTEK